MKRALIAAGGTGGHFYPGLVAAQELKARGWEPLLIVKKDDPAKERLEKAGLACLEVDLGGMPRSIGLGLVTFTVKLIASMRLMSRVAKDFKPDLVLGMGGYLTFPVAYAAWRRNVPVALHESNALLGLANKAAAMLGGTVFWGLPPAEGNGKVVGTPVRPALYGLMERGDARRALGLDPGRKTILVFGGSQGAQAINRAVPKAMRDSKIDAQVLHLAGKGKSEETLAAYQAAGITATVLDYLEDMAAAYAAADIVVCRSGASTLAELAAQRKTAILVPYPHAAADHQDANARVFERNGTALRITETGLYDDLGPSLAKMLASTTPTGFDDLKLPPAAMTTSLFVDELEKLVK
ncbi:MAG: UDP-N-acetylglucosamine--N-acetylmuramyl-(pentapeptide) pyrophosphoryl-undecaprenol N-acetylglucosamine transferase [Elusimicrobiota bacterium]|nr:UDP-N-acetylglucosamine--N-acetylmuramyl-(pentapeptide) pyrophosphoryl-undecaprenol N-acetylglucosamine transferase [Elusimicrobiota bacterium]